MPTIASNAASLAESSWDEPASSCARGRSRVLVLNPVGCISDMEHLSALAQGKARFRDASFKPRAAVTPDHPNRNRDPLRPR